MSDSGQYLSKAEEGYWGYCDFVDGKCRISDNDLLKSIAEISETAQQIFREKQNSNSAKMTSSYHLCVECFSQLSFDSEMYTKSAAVADFVYTSESNESCEKHSTKR